MPSWFKSTRVYSLLFGILWSRKRLNRRLAKGLGNRVVGGFAEGMLMSDDSSWGNVANKLAGTYERELIRVWRQLEGDPPCTIFDVGAADGYYAVGSALRWPESRVTAWEASPDSRAELAEAAQRNGVTTRVRILDECEEPALHRALLDAQPDLVIMDVEGAETTLCSKRNVVAAVSAVWVVECHGEADLMALVERFKGTHDAVVVRNEARTDSDCPATLPWCCRVLAHDRWRIVNEGRPFPTPWLVAWPRRPS